jgi:thiamine biosynthesis protein ThiS
MALRVNAEPTRVPHGTTLAQLIERLGLASTVCAAEVNRTLVPRSRRAEHHLSEGDDVEIVTLVGGG